MTAVERETQEEVTPVQAQAQAQATNEKEDTSDMAARFAVRAEQLRTAVNNREQNILMTTLCCVGLVVLSNIILGAVYLSIANAVEVGTACTKPSYNMSISPVNWLLGIGTAYLVAMVLNVIFLTLTACAPIAGIAALSVLEVLWLGWRLAEVIVTGFVLFRQMNPSCYGTAVYNCLLAEFILCLIVEFCKLASKSAQKD